MKRQQKDMDSWRDIIEAAGLPSDMRVEGGAISAYLRTCDGHGQDNLMEKLASIMRDEKKKLQKSMEETFVVSSNKTKSRDASMLQENLIASEGNLSNMTSEFYACRGKMSTALWFSI
eukprot:GHVH01007664.1.p1 GENE.GHVH01007664.1~~GHVH01007664.1.p1  ORF type:complete len:118 (+),score=17.64 GHVH01007664.1:16-369(+)